MKYINFIIVLTLTTLSCTEEIPWDGSSSDEFPIYAVVEGKITTDTTSHLVKLTWSKPMDNTEDFEPIVGADVKVECDGTVTQLTEEEPGNYYTPDDFYGLPGNVYTLSINGVDTDEDGVPDPITATDSICEPHLIDSLAVEWFDLWEAWQFLIWAPVRTGENYYMFKCYVNDTLVTDTITEIGLASDEMIGDTIRGLDVYYLNQEDPDESLEDGDKVTIEVDVVTLQTLEFMWQAQTEAGFSTPLFSGPPANVVHNIVGKNAFGIFMTYSYDTKSIYWSDTMYRKDDK